MIIKRRYKLSPYAKEAVFYFRFSAAKQSTSCLNYMPLMSCVSPKKANLNSLTAPVRHWRWHWHWYLPITSESICSLLLENQDVAEHSDSVTRWSLHVCQPSEKPIAMQLFHFWLWTIVHVKEVKVTIFESPQWLKKCQDSKPRPLTLGTEPACISWCVLSRSPTIRWTLKHALGQNVWSMCLDLHHVWPASTEGHANTRQTITRNKYRQAPSFRHVTWICMLTAVRNFLSLTPTPPHPHIHLSNMTPLPTRRRPGSQPSSRKPDCPHLFCERNELLF